MAELTSSIDAFMLLEAAKTGVVKGESQDAGHTNEIQLLSFGWGVTNNAKSVAGDGDWKPDFGDVVVTSYLSRASPFLFKAAADGTMFKKVTISFRKAGAKKTGEAGGDYLQFRFCNAMISSYSVSHTETPIETVNFNYQTCEKMYLQQGQGGSLDEKYQKGWHVGKNIELAELTLPYKGGGAKDK